MNQKSLDAQKKKSQIHMVWLTQKIMIQASILTYPDMQDPPDSHVADQPGSLGQVPGPMPLLILNHPNPGCGHA